MARNLQTELLLLQIAEGLQNLVKNPDLSSAIKEANALSDAEKARADEAMALIAQADQLRAGFQKREEALAGVNERISKAETLEEANKATLKLIEAKKNELDIQGRKNISDATANEVEVGRLNGWEADLKQRIVDMEHDENEIKEIKADLKKRVEAVQAQAAGL